MQEKTNSNWFYIDTKCCFFLSITKSRISIDMFLFKLKNSFSSLGILFKAKDSQGGENITTNQHVDAVGR